MVTFDQSSASAAARSLYINTMVFAIIAALVSMTLLLILIYVPSARVFVYGIATIELGLIAIIIAAIVSIYAYEKKMTKKAQEGNQFLVTVDTCPDYFSNSWSTPSTSTNGPANGPANGPSTNGSTSGVTCKNGYVSPDGDKTYYFIKKGCTSTTLNDPKCIFNGTNTSDYKIVLNTPAYKATSSTALCKEVNVNDTETVFSNIPWTDVKSRCNSLNLGAAMTG